MEESKNISKNREDSLRLGLAVLGIDGSVEMLDVERKMEIPIKKEHEIRLEDLHDTYRV